MGWGVITGDQSLIPSGSSNELILESGKPKKIRLLLAPGEEPYSFFQHRLEVEKMENGQQTSTFRTVNCTKTNKNPYAHCPLCDGQQAPRRVRNVANVWDYELGQVRILAGGEKIWKPIATMAKMGIDVSTLDWIVTKSGTSRNDTDYAVVNMGATAFQLPAGAQLFDMVTEYAPHTVEEMKSTVEGLGLSWGTMIVPPPIQYPKSLQEALVHVVPNTKYKGQTMQQIWDNNKGMVEYFAKSNRVTPEKAAAQVILVALGGAQIDGVPNYAMGGAVTSAPQVTPRVQNPVAPTQAPAPTTPSAPVANAQSQQSPDRQGKINEINKLLQTNEKFTKGGYQVVIDTMRQATAPANKISINDFTDVELDNMLRLCK